MYCTLQPKTFYLKSNKHSCQKSHLASEPFHTCNTKIPNPLPRSTSSPAKCLRRPANHTPKYPSTQSSRSELQNTQTHLKKEKPTWHDASLFVNQHAKRFRVLEKFSNKHRMVLRLLRWLGSSCAAWDRAENARMYRRTPTPHCGLGSYLPPEHQPLFERILAIPAPVSQVQLARSEDLTTH